MNIKYLPIVLLVALLGSGEAAEGWYANERYELIKVLRTMSGEGKVR
jgi:hypothetical protein